jgi:hypothetical protein
MYITADARQTLTEMLGHQPMSTIVNMLNTQIRDLPEEWERSFYLQVIQQFSSQGDKGELISSLLDIAEKYFGLDNFLEFMELLVPPVPSYG